MTAYDHNHGHGQEPHVGHEADHAPEADRAPKTGHAHEDGSAHDGRGPAPANELGHDHALGHRPGQGHSHGQGHGHGVPAGRGSARQRRRLWLAAGLNLGIVVGQAVAGFTAGSVGLLADAGHNLTDTAGVILALVALTLSQRPPSARRTFGGVRWPVLAAQANAAAVLVVTALLAVESLRRLGEHGSVDGPVVVAVALAAAVVNAVSALVIHERDADLNTRAAVLHLAGDAAVSVAVAASGLVIWLVGGWYWLDPLVSLLIAVLIAGQGVKLLVSASRVLLEATPESLDVAAVRADILRDEHVLDVHDLHVWSLSDRVFAASVHLELGHLDGVQDGHPSLAQARAVSDGIKAMLAERYAITHVTIESECEPCTPPDDDPCGIARGLGGNRAAAGEPGDDGGGGAAYGAPDTRGDGDAPGGRRSRRSRVASLPQRTG